MTDFRKYFELEQINMIQKTGADWGLTVYDAGHNDHPPNQLYPDKSHPEDYKFTWDKGRVLNEYQLVYIPSGTGFFETEYTGILPVKAGTAFLLFPGVWHRFKPERETGWEEYWVGFRGSFADHLMGQECFSGSDPLIQVGYNSEFIQIFLRLLATLQSESAAFPQLASCLTIQLLGLVYASAFSKAEFPDRKHQIIHKITSQLNERWNEDIDLKELALKNNVSYIWFRKAFKEVICSPPGQYVLNIKVERSCELLKETDQSISEISYACGFSSEQHFSRSFKLKIGITPSIFRQKWPVYSKTSK